MRTKHGRRRAIGTAAAALLLVALPATPALAGNGDVTCDGVAPVSVSHDLIVPAGGSCTILDESTIKHDVIVNTGAVLNDRGAFVGHDITADHPKGMSVGGGGVSSPNPGRVGHDVRIDGVTDDGTLSGHNIVCNNVIGHDLVVTNSSSLAALWVIGLVGPDCGRANTVGHDLTVTGNANRVVVSDNGPGSAFGGGDIGHDLTIAHNSGGVTANNNNAGHDCSQTDNHPYTGSGNTAKHSTDSCNSANG